MVPKGWALLRDGKPAQQAAELAPDIEELPFWHAVILTDNGKVDEVLPIFERVLNINKN
jgi:hypothetical protein